jgi:hypothetical protein
MAAIVVSFEVEGKGTRKIRLYSVIGKPAFRDFFDLAIWHNAN